MSETPLIESSSLTERDKENRALAYELIKNSNEVVTSFAKQMVTTSLSAVGVILALAKFRGITDHPDGWPLIVLALMCAGCLAAALIFAFALRARRIRVSLEDYADAPSQLLEAAHQREVLATAAVALLALSIIGTVISFILL
jgi:hypothetical protein